jgi:integrase
VDSRELTAAMWGEYYHMAERVIETIGGERTVADLRPADFGTLRAAAAKRLGPVGLHKFVTMTRTMFKHAFSEELIDVPVRYGDRFDKPPRNVLRLTRAMRAAKLIGAADLCKLLDAADPAFRAMLYLGINCGFGQTDCADLQRAVLGRRPGWLDVPRRKTGIGRRCPLWPETQDALREAIAARPDPKDPADADCVFLTNQGNRWCRHMDRGDDRRGFNVDAVARKFARDCKAAGVSVRGGFYVLRHTFRTVADEMKDQPAAMLVMGHADQSISQYYRERVGDDRLVAITNHVRDWLLTGQATE